MRQLIFMLAFLLGTSTPAQAELQLPQGTASATGTITLNMVSFQSAAGFVAGTPLPDGGTASGVTIPDCTTHDIGPCIPLCDAQDCITEITANANKLSLSK